MVEIQPQPQPQPPIQGGPTGPQGPAGPTGPQGPQGASPQVAMAMGFEASMEQGQVQGQNLGNIPQDCPACGDNLDGFPQDCPQCGQEQGGGGNLLEKLAQLLQQLLGDGQQGGQQQPAFAGGPQGPGGGQVQGQSMKMKFKFAMAALLGGDKNQAPQGAPGAPSGLESGLPTPAGPPPTEGLSPLAPIPQRGTV